MDERRPAGDSERPDQRPEQRPNLGVLLFVSYRALEKRAYDAAVAAGAADLTIAQARILQRVGPHGTRVSDLAEQALVTKQTAGYLVEQLERAGYVERVPDPSDGRARLVRLSTRAERLVPAADAEVRRVLSEWEAHVGPDAMRRLDETLARLWQITDPQGEASRS
jgi:DNA-binding MarR family transcriptional regulator